MKILHALALGFVGFVVTIAVTLTLESGASDKLLYQVVGRNVGVRSIEEAGVQWAGYAWSWGFLPPLGTKIYSDEVLRTPPVDIRVSWTVQDEKLEQVLTVPEPPVGMSDEDRILRVEFDPEREQAEVFWTTELFPDSKHRGPGS